ncbi:hypothetical protein [Fodinibius sp. Rm-B-1B1-1]|uniref:hypothetical protein n=1 Tax=Fodinibius alkaliphilus TaxID=3140241 RepID=UPI003159E951
MHQSPSELFKHYLDEQNISPREFSDISGMPLAEVQGLLDRELSITKLRAHHLATVFDTDVDLWLEQENEPQQEQEVSTMSK